MMIWHYANVMISTFQVVRAEEIPWLEKSADYCQIFVPDALMGKGVGASVLKKVRDGNHVTGISVAKEGIRGADGLCPEVGARKAYNKLGSPFSSGPVQVAGEINKTQIL